MAEAQGQDGAVDDEGPANVAYVSFSAEIVPKTTETLLGVCTELANRKADAIYLLLSTPGGQVMHGLAIYNVLRGLPCKVITHNVGNVDSIGNVVFLAGDERYACPHTTFMFHGVGFDITQPMRFEEKGLRERLGSVKADQGRIGGVIVDRTSLTEKEVSKLFLEAKTRDVDYAQKTGIVHDVRDVKIPRGASVTQLVFQR